MANAEQMMTEQQKTVILEYLWLSYYNSTLYEQGLITETERNKMMAHIKSRKATADSRKRSGGGE
ncbi:MAG: hypothetical protein LUH36_01115 [Oscillospiraceae bacterium]|nr:hypothetical protein [Oscillospiraceae bacterium]